MYKVIFLPGAEDSFKRLDKNIQKRVAEKLDWLAENAESVIHHPLKSMPDDLKGLCRMRVGDYRIIYWIYNHEKTIKIYEIEHRGQAYRFVRRK
jgi:mRNA interferase RelE/StbE